MSTLVVNGLTSNRRFRVEHRSFRSGLVVLQVEVSAHRISDTFGTRAGLHILARRATRRHHGVPHMIILDLDNCISNDQWRRQTIDLSLPIPEPWDIYHSLFCFDEVGNKALCELIASGALGHCTAIFTARPERHRAGTIEWIEKVAGIPRSMFSLHMRPDGDTRSSVELKRDMLRNLYNRNRVSVALDDRRDVLAMYEAEGIVAIRLFINEQEN